MKRILVLLIFSMLLFGQGLFAASSVYWCPNTTAAGWAWNHETLDNARDAAYQACIDYGGINPKEVASSSTSGYGVIMFGYDAYGVKWITAQLSYGSLEQAKNAAIASLKNVGAVYDMVYYYFQDVK